MPNNPVYCSLYNDQIICQKSSIEKVDFDVLFFCVQNLETITIPNFIETIGAFSFESSEIKSVEFPPDSKLKLIENHAFDFSKIESIKIPPHLTKISNRSFVFCGNLHQFDIPENSELQVIDESAFQNVIIESIKIPPHLTKICRNAFNHCGNLKSIEIPYNSELKTIEESAFAFAAIESFTIPSCLVDLQEGWCRITKNIAKVKIMPNNPRYLLYEDNFILGKSFLENDYYNFFFFFFCVRKIGKKMIKLPDFVTVIDSHAFEFCKIHSIEISVNSKLQTIKNAAFACSNITCFSLPPKVKKICEETFFYCNNLRYFDIPENSELQIIEYRAFAKTRIEEICIPPHVTQICKESFYDCEQLRNIKILPNSELRTIEINAFEYTQISSFFVPSLIENIDDFAFGYNNNNLQIFEVDKKYQMNLFNHDFLENINNEAIFMIPVE